MKKTLNILIKCPPAGPQPQEAAGSQARPCACPRGPVGGASAWHSPAVGAVRRDVHRDQPLRQPGEARATLLGLAVL